VNHEANRDPKYVLLRRIFLWIFTTILL